LSSRAETNRDSPHISRLQFVWLALGYLFFAVYGSLVPLEFRALPLADAWLAFRDILSMGLSFSSRADWLVNILLFIPLAFLLAGALWPSHGLLVALAVFAVFVICLALSVAIEFAQLFFPQRTPSLNDITAQTIGAGLGVASWMTFGSRLSAWFIGWRCARGPMDIWKRLLYSYLFVLFAYNLLPLDLTISPVEILHKWREGRVVLLPFSFPFPSPIEALYDFGTDVLVWIPAAFLWSLAFHHQRLRAWLGLVCAAIGLEFLQLFVYSRVSDVTDIFTAALGAAIGIWLTRQPAQAPTGEAAWPLSHSGWFWFLLAFLWAAALSAVFFYPFDFQTDREFLAQRLHGARTVPFEVYYFATEYRAATEVLHKIGFFLPLGSLLALGIRTSGINRDGRWGRYAGFIVTILIAIAAFFIEAGQLFLPGKNVDVTDWGLEVLGGVIGFAIIRYLDGVSPSGQPGLAASNPQAGSTPAMDTIAVQNMESRKGVEMSGNRALAVMAIGCAAGVAAAWLVMRSSLTPYNVRELMDARHPLLSLVLLAVAFYWVAGFPVLITQWLARGGLYLLSLPPLALIHGLATWVLLRLAVPMESIHDIVGSPILDWPWEWELLGRFLALFGFWSTAMIGGALVASRPLVPHFNSALIGWSAGACVLVPLTYYVVVAEASTDNLVELIANNGGVGAFLLIGLAVATASSAGTRIALASAFALQSGRVAAAAAWVAGSAALTYIMLYFGTEQVIVKYDQVFSAMQFLLSSDRSHLASSSELILRFAAIYSVLITATAIVQYPLWRLISQSQRHPDLRAFPHSAGNY
jgi:VanZ family protein